MSASRNCVPLHNSCVCGVLQFSLPSNYSNCAVNNFNLPRFSSWAQHVGGGELMLWASLGLPWVDNKSYSGLIVLPGDSVCPIHLTLPAHDCHILEHEYIYISPSPLTSRGNETMARTDLGPIVFHIECIAYHPPSSISPRRPLLSISLIDIN